MKKILLTLPILLLSSYYIIAQNIYSFTFNGSNYDIVEEKLSWEDAAAYAVNLGGYLVHINSIEEQNAIYDTIVNGAQISDTYTIVTDGGGVAYIWIGATDKNTEDDWIWDGDNDSVGDSFWSGNGNGSAVNNAYFNWGGTAEGTPNEPDDFFSNQDAAAIGLKGWPAILENLGSASEWNDIDIDNELYFIIEYDNTSINENDNNELNIFPNPANDMVSITSENIISEITIINIAGANVFQSMPNSKKVIQEIDLPTGIYFISVQIENGTFIQSKLVISR